MSLNDVFTGAMSFRRLNALIKGLPGDGTAMWRASRRNVTPDAKGSPPPAEWWTPERDLLAQVIDGQNVLIWQKTKDATSGKNPPRPIARPGVKDDAQRHGKPMSATEVLARLRPGSEPVDPHREPQASEDPEGDAPSGES